MAPPPAPPPAPHPHPAGPYKSNVVPGPEHFPDPLRIPSDLPEVIRIHDDHLPPVRRGWVLVAAPLVARGDPVGGAAEEVFVAVAGEGGGHADGWRWGSIFLRFN
jgi:hypothetical protein